MTGWELACAELAAARRHHSRCVETLDAAKVAKDAADERLHVAELGFKDAQAAEIARCEALAANRGTAET